MSVPVREQVHSALDEVAGSGQIPDAAVEVVCFALAAAAGDAAEVAAEVRRRLVATAPDTGGRP